VATFANLAISKAGTGYTLIVSASGLAGAASTPFNAYEFHTANHLSVGVPAVATLGTPLTVLVTALDASNNPDNSYAGTIHFGCTDPAAMLPAGATLSNGVGSFSVILHTIGSQTITASDGSLTGSASTLGASALVFLSPPPPPPAPTGDANALFVAGLYRDILGRQPDLAGSNNYLNQLQQGVARAAVAQALLQSAEHLSAEVTSYYQTFLNRAPDSAGLAHWVGALQTGATQQQLGLSFVSSAEFINQHVSHTQYVTALYIEILGRSPDAGSAGWVGALDNGTLSESQVAAIFINSGEALRDVVDAYYMAYLVRAADSQGEGGWVKALQSGQATLDSVAALFLGSAEYANDVAAGLR
jgi:hypothetical protein